LSDIQSLSLTCFVVISQLSLWKVYIERDEQRASDVVVLVVWHTFVLLGNTCTRPRHLLTFYQYLVTVQVVYLHCEAGQRIDQSDGQVCV